MFERWMYHFAYSKLGRPGRDRDQLHLRDLQAALFLSAALADRGYRYKEPIINYPWNAERPFDAASVPLSLTAADCDKYRAHDILVETTRPAMSDRDFPDRKKSVRSFTTLEERAYGVPGQYLDTCARTQIMLKAWIAALSPELAMHESMEFRQHCGSTYRAYGPRLRRRELKKFKQEDGLTAVFLCYAEHAWPDGPAVLMAWGMGYMETLVWCYRLANDFSHLLCTNAFVLAEMRRGDLQVRPGSFDFANSWDIDIIGAVELPLAADPVHAV